MSRTTLALVVAVVIALFGLALLAPVAAAQEDGTPTPTATAGGGTSGATGGNATSTPGGTTTATATATATATPTPDAGGGEWTLTELQRGGEQPSSAPESVRYLPDRNGAVALRYSPAAPLENEMTFLEAGTTLNTDDLQLYSTRFGVEREQDFTLRAVFYTVRSETENGTTTRAAANVRERTYRMTFGYGYDTANITLPSHYQEPVRVLLQLEQGGEPVRGGRWTFTHQTIQSEQAPATAIDSRGDLWRWAGINIFSVLIPGLLLSAVGVKGVIRKTGRGPDKSLTWWTMFVVVPAVFLIATVGFFRTAQVAARLPQIFGVLAVLIGAIAMLETMGRKRRTDEFVRDELQDAQAPLGDALENVVYEDKSRVYTVPRDDGLGLIKTGIRPFLARLFAEPAVLETKTLKTQIEIHGPDDKKFIADPEADEPLQWKPAHWEMQWSPFREGTEGDGLINRFRWPLAAAAGIGFAIGGAIGTLLFDVALVPAGVGAVMMYLVVVAKARDGHATFEPAPVHYAPARATISARQQVKKDSQTVRDLYEENWNIRANTAREIKELSGNRDRTVSERLAAEEAGVDVFDLQLDDEEAEEQGDAAGRAKSAEKGGAGKEGVIDFDSSENRNGDGSGGGDDE